MKQLLGVRSNESVLASATLRVNFYFSLKLKSKHVTLHQIFAWWTVVDPEFELRVSQSTRLQVAILHERFLASSRSQTSSFIWGSIFQTRTEFTQRKAEGGGAVSAPPSCIFSVAQKLRQISTRNFQYLNQHQFDAFYQMLQKNASRIEKKFLVAPCFHPFV